LTTAVSAATHRALDRSRRSSKGDFIPSAAILIVSVSNLDVLLVFCYESAWHAFTAFSVVFHALIAPFQGLNDSEDKDQMEMIRRPIGIDDPACQSETPPTTPTERRKFGL
jgi:hypothetical protein